MKYQYLLLFFLVILSGCSSTTLEEAIEKGGGYNNVQILFQDTNDQVVIFSGEDRREKTRVGINIYSTRMNAFHYESGTGEFSQLVDLSKNYDLIYIERIKTNSIPVFWGWLYNYPDANEFIYSIYGKDGSILYESTIDVNKNGIVYEKLPIDIINMEGYHYKIIDSTGTLIRELGDR